MSENYIDISKMTEDDKQSHIDNVETAMDYSKNLTDDRKIFKRGKCL